jgi:hypothetical protein
MSAMSDLYDTDVLTWSEQQADLLRRLAAGERVNDQVDWENVVEEIESVGISEIHAALSHIDNIVRHRVYLLGWPEAPAARGWTAELHEAERQLRRRYRPSMTGTGRVTDAEVREAYAAALGYCTAHMDTAPTVPLPLDCPWILEMLLADAA